jgi:hypothetical protein
MSGVFGILRTVMPNKSKKKRNKQYRGIDAAVTKPSVTRISAANRSTLGQWWFERKRFAKPVLITAGIAIVVVWLIFELIRIVT